MSREKKLAAVQAEIALERAAALGLSERRLKDAIAELRGLDAGQRSWRSRAQVLQTAVDACVGYVVQREAMGYGALDLGALRTELGIPDEVWNRMGAVTAPN